MLQLGAEPLSRVGVLVAKERIGLRTGCHFGVNSGRAERSTLEEERCIVVLRCWGHRNLLILKDKTYPGDTQN